MATFPSKVNYATGDILTATNMNDVGGAINLLNGAQVAAGKNAVLNSNFSVWQRGTSFTALTASQATADRWFINPGVAGGSGAVTRQATSDTTNLPNIQYCARVQRTAANTGTNPFYLAQSFESVNSIPFAGKAITVSFYARAGANFSAASSLLGVQLLSGTGTDQNFITVAYTGQATVAGANVTLTTTWQRFTVSGTVASTATELALYFVNTPVGTAGAADYYEVTGVQLEAANTASPYAPNGATYQAELAACQRYYWRGSGASAYGGWGTGSGETTTSSYIVINNPVNMRTTPSSVDYSSLALYDQVAVTAVTGVTIGNSTAGTTTVRATVASGLTVYRPYILLNNNSTSGYIGFSAEL
jgi:hypothetical protein